ncbi:hypothetical protein AALB39_18200 [Lachnospiraceae bacterium 54-53]
MKQITKYLFLWLVGGCIYIGMELLFRGRSHWTMLVLGGVCFVSLGLINQVIPWEMPLYQQILLGDAIVTILEFMTGCVVNIWLGWGIWDYSHLPGNILGQICPLFSLLWLPVCLAGIILDDWLRHWLFSEERPYYKFT